MTVKIGVIAKKIVAIIEFETTEQPQFISNRRYKVVGDSLKMKNSRYDRILIYRIAPVYLEQTLQSSAWFIENKKWSVW